MKLRYFLFSIAVLVVILPAKAQTGDEIINKYFEITGGVNNWRALTGMINKAIVKQGEMEIPITVINLKDGRSIMKFELQGQEFVQKAFDGTIAWGTNFMTMEAEKSDAEVTENRIRESGDFPDAFLDYKEKGYTIELQGKETVEGVNCFKIKLTKNSKLIGGQEVENISFYYFDSENFVPLVVEQEIMQGEQKGSISRITFKNYQEVNGLKFAFSITQGIKGGESQSINFTSIELNPKVDNQMFKFPTPKEEGNK